MMISDDIFIFDESGTILKGVKDKSIKSVTIPDSVKSIGNEAFYCCTSLASIIIPKSVTSVGHWAFAECTSLATIKVDSANPKYDSRNNCNAIIETSSNTLIFGCKNTVIPDNVKAIGTEAFTGCTGLTSINIPDSVTSIGKRAFDDCKSLRIIHSTVMIIDNINISDNTFDEFIIDKCTLYIPSGTRWSYRHHPVFSKFKNIEIETKRKE